jgi:hypothetical protein
MYRIRPGTESGQRRSLGNESLCASVRVLQVTRRVQGLASLFVHVASAAHVRRVNAVLRPQGIPLDVPEISVAPVPSPRPRSSCQ